MCTNTNRFSRTNVPAHNLNHIHTEQTILNLHKLAGSPAPTRVSMLNAYYVDE